MKIKKIMILVFATILPLFLGGIVYYCLVKNDINNQFCDYELNGLKSCIGKTITIDGNKQTHQIKYGPKISSYNTDSEYPYEQFIETSIFQFHAGSKEEIKCQDKMIITGTLKLIGEMDCPKNSTEECWGGYGINVEEWKCR